MVDEYIPRTILEKATAPCSYIIEVQGKRYRRTREHVLPIHLNLHPLAQNHKKQCISGPSPPKSCIPRTSLSISSLPRPSILARPPLPCHTSKVSSCTPNPSIQHQSSYCLSKCRRPSPTPVCLKPSPQC